MLRAKPTVRQGRVLRVKGGNWGKGMKRPWGVGGCSVDALWGRGGGGALSVHPVWAGCRCAGQAEVGCVGVWV